MGTAIQYLNSLNKRFTINYDGVQATYNTTKNTFEKWIDEEHPTINGSSITYDSTGKLVVDGDYISNLNKTDSIPTREHKIYGVGENSFTIAGKEGYEDYTFAQDGATFDDWLYTGAKTYKTMTIGVGDDDGIVVGPMASGRYLFEEASCTTMVTIETDIVPNAMYFVRNGLPSFTLVGKEGEVSYTIGSSTTFSDWIATSPTYNSLKISAGSGNTILIDGENKGRYLYTDNTYNTKVVTSDSLVSGKKYYISYGQFKIAEADLSHTETYVFKGYDYNAWWTWIDNEEPEYYSLPITVDDFQVLVANSAGTSRRAIQYQGVNVSSDSKPVIGNTYKAKGGEATVCGVFTFYKAEEPVAANRLKKLADGGVVHRLTSSFAYGTFLLVGNPTSMTSHVSTCVWKNSSGTTQKTGVTLASLQSSQSELYNAIVAWISAKGPGYYDTDKFVIIPVVVPTVSVETAWTKAAHGYWSFWNDTQTTIIAPEEYNLKVSNTAYAD